MSDDREMFIDARGADPAALARLEESIKKITGGSLDAKLRDFERRLAALERRLNPPPKNWDNVRGTPR